MANAPIPDPFLRTPPTGPGLDNKTRAALNVVERDLGYTLTIVQPSYSGATASAGTHLGGGAVDLAPYDQANKVKVLRNRGFAAWYRPAIAGLWGAHIHAILIDHGKLADSAARQVTAYLDGLDGLAGSRRDTNTYRPKPPVVFKYSAAVWDERRRTRILDIKARRKALADKLSAVQAKLVYKKKKP